MTRPLQRLCTGGGIAALALGLAAPAFAHPGHEATLMQGLVHPFSGLDHLLAMISVGLWASLRGGKAMWAWPAAFVAAMVGGFALGQAGVQLPMVEPAILASVMILGAMTAAALPAPTLAGVALIGLFGLAHGYAHGAEALRAGAGFPIGFVLSTASLHLVGLFAGLTLARLRRPALVQALGAGAALGGVALAFAG